jgi:hypothetical protein
METCDFRECATAGVFSPAAPSEKHRRDRAAGQGAGMVQTLWRAVGRVEKRDCAVSAVRRPWNEEPEFTYAADPMKVLEEQHELVVVGRNQVLAGTNQ